MEEKHELTEKLKVLETEIFNDKSDLNAINYKLESSYKYEDELSKRQVLAKEKTEKIRNEFFKKSSEITQKYNEMKNIFDLFTGNFYRE